MYHKMNFTNLCLGYRLKLNLVAYKGKSKQKKKKHGTRTEFLSNLTAQTDFTRCCNLAVIARYPGGLYYFIFLLLFFCSSSHLVKEEEPLNS